MGINNLEELIGSISEMISNGLIAEARSEIAKAEQKRDSGDPEYAGLVTFGLRGLCFIEELQWGKAKEMYSAFIQESPDSWESFCNRGLCNWWLNNPQDALKDYLAALKLNPSSQVALKSAGRLLGEKGEIKQAMDYLESARELEPADPEVLISMGILLIEIGKEKDGYELLFEAKKLDPSNSRLSNYI